MTKVAQLLRKRGIEASTAHVEEATKLSNALAMLRGLEIPGIKDLEDAAVAVFGMGYPHLLEMIQQKF